MVQQGDEQQPQAEQPASASSALALLIHVCVGLPLLCFAWAASLERPNPLSGLPKRVGRARLCAVPGLRSSLPCRTSTHFKTIQRVMSDAWMKMQPRPHYLGSGITRTKNPYFDCPAPQEHKHGS